MEVVKVIARALWQLFYLLLVVGTIVVVVGYLTI